MMTSRQAKHIVLAASLSLAFLVGCAPAPTASNGPAPSDNGGTVTGAPADNSNSAPIASGSFGAGATANVTSTTAQVATATDAKALAVNDEGFVESASTSLETKEAADATAAYTTLAVDATASSAAAASGTVVVPAPRKPKPPAYDARWEQTQLAKLDERRAKAKLARDFYCRNHADACRDEALIARILDNQTWQPSTDIAGAIYKVGSTSSTFTGDKGRTTKRNVSVLRVIAKVKPHRLIHGTTDISDAYADGATKTVHWDKSLQADGSYDIVYHHEYTGPKGRKWVTDWQKTLKADGTLVGTGTFTAYDATGAVISQDTVTIGGSDTTTQTVTSGSSGGGAASPAPSSAPSATASVAPTAAASATTTTTASASPASASATVTTTATASTTP